MDKSELEKKAKEEVFQHFENEVNYKFFQRNYIGISSTLQPILS